MADSAASAWFKWLGERLADAHSSPRQRTVILAAAAVAAAAAGATAGAYALHRLFRRKPRVLGVIPARWSSTRFRGKPLARILGKPMIQRTWENAKLAKSLTRVVVATDDERIAQCCRDCGAEVMMTSPSCHNGSERCAEVVQRLRQRFDVVVNIQGDEPLLQPDAIDAVVATLERRPQAVAATAVADIDPQAAPDPNRVKCVVDQSGHALYFSRALIPCNKNGTPNLSFPYMLHLGLQAFRPRYLLEYVRTPHTPLEVEEQLEQLRIIESGHKLADPIIEYDHKLAVVKVPHRGHGVDTPADIKRVEEVLRHHS